MIDPILPGATIGVFGGGPGSRLFASVARRMGYRVATYSPVPAGAIADTVITAAYEDLDEVRRFASLVKVVTFELDTVPKETMEAAEAAVPVRPSPAVLFLVQNRIRQKGFLKRAGLPITPYRDAKTFAELQRGVGEIAYPAAVKKAAAGEDTHGYFRLDSPQALGPAWEFVAKREAVAEPFLELRQEITIVAARSEDGVFAP